MMKQLGLIGVLLTAGCFGSLILMTVGCGTIDEQPTDENGQPLTYCPQDIPVNVFSAGGCQNWIGPNRPQWPAAGMKKDGRFCATCSWFTKPSPYRGVLCVASCDECQ